MIDFYKNSFTVKQYLVKASTHAPTPLLAVPLFYITFLVLNRALYD